MRTPRALCEASGGRRVGAVESDAVSRTPSVGQGAGEPAVLDERLAQPGAQPLGQPGDRGPT